MRTNNKATQYVRQMRKSYIHYALILQAMDIATRFYKTSMAAITSQCDQNLIDRLLRIHSKAIKRAARRSDRYNRYTTYAYGFRK